MHCRRLLFALLAVALLLAPACASNPDPQGPPTTTGGRVAYQAGRVLEGVKEIQKFTASVEAAGQLPTNIAGTIMIAAYKSGDWGEKLADVAAAYDAAVAAGATGDEGRLASEINTLLTSIESEFKPPKLKLSGQAPKIAQLIITVLTAANQVRALIPVLKDLVQPVPPISQI